MKYNFVYSYLDKGRLMLARWVFNVEGKINGNLLTEIEDYIGDHEHLGSNPIIISWQKMEED